MLANRWYRRYPVGLLYPRQSIMCLWCALNAVCSSGHLPKYALGESECVSMQLSQVGANICMDNPWVPESFHYSSELPFYEEMRVRALVGFSTCGRNSHGKTGFVMFDLKQGLHVSKKILCVFNQQYMLLTFPVCLSSNMKKKLIRGFFCLFFFQK